jgi:hypothetical protein
VIPDVARWSRHSSSDGRVHMVAPDGRTTIAVRFGCRPRRSLHALARALGVPAAHHITRFVTHDGELGAYITSRSPSREYALATISFDDEQLVIEGTGDPEANVAECVLDVARRLPSNVPAERVRAYVYRAPAGWLGLRRPYATCWLAPTFPRSHARIVVCDATPLGADIARTLSLAWPSPVAANRTRLQHDKLSGTRTIEQVGSTYAAAIELACETFQYRILLHDGTLSDIAALDSLVTTIEPCPGPHHDAAPIMAAFGWMT